MCVCVCVGLRAADCISLKLFYKLILSRQRSKAPSLNINWGLTETIPRCLFMPDGSSASDGVNQVQPVTHKAAQDKDY